MALVMVIVVVGFAGVLGSALLAAGALQTQIGANASRSADADGLAESGANLGMYYLQYPANAPVGFLVGTGPWSYSGITLASSVPGTVDLTVSRLATNLYEIISTGRAGAAGSSEISRMVNAQVRLNTTFSIQHAAGANGDLTVGAKTMITGSPNAIQTNGKVTVEFALLPLVRIKGNVSASSVEGLLSAIVGILLPPPPGGAPIPTSSQINYYTDANLKYIYDGKEYTAQELSNDLSSSPVPSINNPGKLFVVRSGDLKISSSSSEPINIPGTVIIRSGRLEIKGGGTAGSNVLITNPQEGFPAVVTQGEIRLNGKNQKLQIEGVVYAGSGIKSFNDTTGSELKVNGALLLAGNGVDTNFKGSVTINYVPEKANVPDLSTANTTVLSVRVLNWTVQ